MSTKTIQEIVKEGCDEIIVATVIIIFQTRLLQGYSIEEAFKLTINHFKNALEKQQRKRVKKNDWI